MERLKDKVAFVTGAARGQGRSHAVRLAEEGADIIAIDICEQIDSVPFPLASAEDLEETARLVEATGRRIVAEQADVRDFAHVKLALDRGIAELGGLDVVVANAGITSYALAHEMEDEAWTDLIEVNLNGVWRTCKAAIPTLIEAGAGSIVIVSSTVGHKGAANVSHYVSAKHGVIGLMRSLAQELGPHGIRVNAVSPTQVETDMVLNKGTFALFCPDVENPTLEEFRVASQAVHLLPVPAVEPLDVSNAVLFLASEESRYVTGISLPVDAGMLAR
jgi:(+)-trans-carveol dehydrogenase